MSVEYKAKFTEELSSEQVALVKNEITSMPGIVLLTANDTGNKKEMTLKFSITDREERPEDIACDISPKELYISFYWSPANMDYYLLRAIELALLRNSIDIHFEELQ